MEEKDALSVNWARTIRSHKGCKRPECVWFSFGQSKAKLTPTADNQRWTLVLRDGIYFFLSYPGKMTDLIWGKLAAWMQYCVAGLQTRHRWESRGLRTMKSLPGGCPAASWVWGFKMEGFHLKPLAHISEQQTGSPVPITLGNENSSSKDGCLQPLFLGNGCGSGTRLSLLVLHG